MLECHGSWAGVPGTHPRGMEVAMKSKKLKAIPVAKTAVLMLAEIKAVTQAFDRGEINVIDALDAIIVAVGAYQAVEQPRRGVA